MFPIPKEQVISRRLQDCFSQQYSDLLGASSDFGDHVDGFYIVSRCWSIFLFLHSVPSAEYGNNNQGPMTDQLPTQYSIISQMMVKW